MTEQATPKRGSVAWRVLPLGILLVAGVLLVAYAGGPQQILAKVAANREWLNGFVQRHGFVTALAYVAIYVGLMTLLWIPPWLCTVIGGFLFGIWLGAPLALVGASRVRPPSSCSPAEGLAGWPSVPVRSSAASRLAFERMPSATCSRFASSRFSRMS